MRLLGKILAVLAVGLLVALASCSTTNPSGEGYEGTPLIPGQTNALPPPAY